MERPLDKTQQDYVDHGGLVNLLQSIKHGLKDLTLTKTRDGKGGEVVSGLKRVERSFYRTAFGEDFLKYHERPIFEIQWMRECGMILSPNPKTFDPLRVGGGEFDGGGQNDSIIRNYNAWWKFCEKNHRRARMAAVLVFGEQHNFSSASRVMVRSGLSASDKTVKGLSELGLELYMQTVRRK